MEPLQYPERDRWRQNAACTGMAQDDYNAFFPTATGIARAMHEDLAKQVCARCPVIAECRAYAFQHEISFGVWGGLTQTERGKHPVAHVTGSKVTDEMVGVTKPNRRPAAVPPEFDLWEFSFTKDEMEATVASRRRRRQVLDRVDAELAALNELLEESA